MHGNKIYTDEMIDYLREISLGRYTDEITRMFNQKFGFNKSEAAIKGLRGRVGAVSKTGTGKREYTDEMIEYLREITPGRMNKEITKMFNEKFKLNKGLRAIKGIRCHYGILTKARHEFPKGHVPWIAGTKGLVKANSTSFKKGMIPHNYQPVGTERINADGYRDVKIADPNVWKQKHHIVWEEHNGKLPKGHAIVFGDSDRLNVDIDNLICVSRQQLLRLNRMDMIQDDAALTRTAINIINLESKIRERGTK